MLDYILPLITLVAGGGASWLIFFRKERRIKEADTRSAEIDTEKQAYEFHSQELQDAYTKILELQDIVDTERNKWISLAKEITELKVALLREEERREIAEFNMCTIKFCERRVP